MPQSTKRIDDLFKSTPVVPILIVEDSKRAVKAARALYEGGLKTIEVTLRTSAAIEAIKAIKGEVEGAVVGAGTVLTAKQYKAASQAGASFIVTPGYTPRLLDIAGTHDIPLIPGVSTVSESMFLLERAYNRLKFFPAEPAGGTKYLGALVSPLPELAFFPTGGITLKSAPDYLALPNVVSVGGSWIAPPKLIEGENWARIKSNARAASKLG